METHSGQLALGEPGNSAHLLYEHELRCVHGEGLAIWWEISLGKQSLVTVIQGKKAVVDSFQDEEAEVDIF